MHMKDVDETATNNGHGDKNIVPLDLEQMTSGLNEAYPQEADSKAVAEISKSPAPIATSAPAAAAKPLSQRFGLKTKATALAVALGVIPVAVIGLVANFIANDSVSNKIIENKKSLTTQISAKVASYMRERYGDIQIMSGLDVLVDPALRKSTSREAKQASLDKFIKAYTIYNSVAFFDLKGNVMAQSSGKALDNHSDRSYFQAAVKSGQPIISQPLLSQSSGVISVYTANVVLDRTSGKPIGVVRARMPVTFLEDLLKGIEGHENGYLVDQNGNLFAGSNEAKAAILAANKTGKPLTGNEKFSWFKDVKTSEIQTLDKDGKLETIVPFDTLNSSDDPFLANLPDLGWKVILETDKDVAFQSVAQLQLALILGTLAAAVVVGALAVVISERATRPIIESAEAVNAIGLGDLETRVNISGEDELAQLGGNINTMAEQLQTLLLEQEYTSQQELKRQQEAAETQRKQNEALQSDLLTLLTDVEAASDGDLTVRANVDASEIGIVGDFFNSIIENLRDIVAQVQVASAQVNDSVSTNSSSIVTLADEASAQAEQVEQSLQFVEDLTQAAQEVADNAQQAAEIAKTASETAVNGGNTMDLTVASIDQLRETVAETAKKVKRLGESSQQISKAVSLINQIALQTNLLAINASIEAARAGEEGRGFAVVAEEVGALASQSATATKEIEQIVENIQLETAEVVNAMEVGTTQVVEGTRMVQDTKQSLGQIVSVSQQISDLVQTISGSTASQTAKAQMLSKLVQNVAKVSENTSDSSRQVAESLQETVEIAKQLQTSVSTFKIGEA
ncbi:methyl-accepting chemotaxis protein [Acaryochloris marina]|uniref:methyl-accepting chemotaxis protein n=1 Tax=Acaryochloris marina TaxID=155978 RepID=UPI001BB019B6|nr:methyl-accepting chemotaxis protein [Acaryochloris marina]QUY40844.1 HAMP domain-containing protein [Acaryochloris marina S15]